MSTSSASVSTRPSKKITRVYGKNRDTLLQVATGTHDSEIEPRIAIITAESSQGASNVDSEAEEEADLQDPFGLKRSLRNIEDNFDETQQTRRITTKSFSSDTHSQAYKTNDVMDLPNSTPFSGSLTPLSSSQEQMPGSSQRVRILTRRHSSHIDSNVMKNNAHSSPISPDPFSMESPKRSPSSPPTSSPDFEYGSTTHNRTKSHPKLPNGESETEFAASISKGKATRKHTRNKISSKRIFRDTITENAQSNSEQSSFQRSVNDNLPLSTFIDKYKQKTPHVSPKDKFKVASSDPIQSFTSPDSTGPGIKPISTFASRKTVDLRTDDEKDFMPDASKLLQETSERKRDRERREKLSGEKRRILELQSKNDEKLEEDDDLEIVENLISSSPPSAGELRKTRFSGFPVKSKTFKTNMPDQHTLKKILKTSAKPHFEQQSSRIKKDILSHRDLENLTRQRAMQQSKEISKRKEDEWIQKGGKLKRNVLENRATMELSELGEKNGAGDKVPEDAESDEDTDSDWSPTNHHSVSPPAKDFGTNGGRHHNDENANNPSFSFSSPPSDDATDAENDIFNGTHRGRSRHLSRRQTRILDSDDENDENSYPQRGSHILVPDTSIMDDVSLDVYNQAWEHRGSASSLDTPSMDEDNKENDGRLMYDQSEDKENTALPSHLVLDRNDQRSVPVRYTGNSLGGLEEGFRRRLSMSPSIDNLSQERKPLGDLDGPSIGTLDFTEKHIISKALFPGIRSRSHSPSPTRSNLLQPAFGDELPLSVPFSDEEDGPLLSHKGEETFSKPSSPSEPVFMQIGGLSQLFSSEEETIDGFNKPNSDVQELSLTMDVKLQPALDISSQMRRQGDAIFEKEQDFILEEVNQREKSVPDLYITEAGLLTQTRPEDSTPIVYRRSSVLEDSGMKSQWSSRYQQSQRQPLGMLTTSDLHSPLQRRNHSRLVKGSRNELNYQADSEAGPSKPTNAYELMLKASHKDKAKPLNKKSEFIQGEAQESDEDEMLGFGRKTADDEDESDGDDEDLNVNLAELVDDNQMDDETLAADKVQEKFQEHQALDDAEIEKLHQAAVAGKLKSKRRGGGVSFDDSEDDSDDEARRVRARMFKKRKIDGDTFDMLGEESHSFKIAYQKDLDDDAGDDFAHLKQDEMNVEDNDEDDEDDEDMDRPRTYSEMTNKLREIARSNEARKGFDAEDVSWAGPSATQDDEELSLQVKEVTSRLKKTSDPRKSTKQIDADYDFERISRPSNPIEQERLKAWQKENGSSSRTFASSSGAAVTGHGQSKSARRTGQNTAASSETEPRKATKSASILASIPGKQSRFE